MDEVEAMYAHRAQDARDFLHFFAGIVKKIALLAIESLPYVIDSGEQK